MLIALGRDIWTVEGPSLCGQAGFHFPTRMCLVRLPDGALWVHSPIALDDGLRAALAAIGPVGHLVAPNTLHHTFLPAWSTAFPDARVHAAPGVQRKCPFVDIDDTLGEVPPSDWADSFDQAVFQGNLITTEVVFFHKPSGTAIFTDLLQQLPTDWFNGWRALVARLDQMTGDAPSVPRKYRLAFRDRDALRRALAKVRHWPVQRLVMAHGPVVEETPALKLDHAFAFAR